MVKRTLPDDLEHLRKTAEQAFLAGEHLVQLMSAVRAEESALQAPMRPEESPRPVVPTTRKGTGVPVSMRLLTQRELINDRLQRMAELIAPLVEHLGLNERDKAAIQSLLPTAGAHARPTGMHDAASTSLLIENDGTGAVYPTGPYSPDAEARNAHRIARLLDLFERLGESLGRFGLRVGAKVQPPTVQDRVQVDSGNCIVTLDGTPYHVTGNQATLFKYLVEANGEIVSGPEIARGEGLAKDKDFKAGRYLKQIKHPELKRIVEQTLWPRRSFRIVLPPLD